MKRHQLVFILAASLVAARAHAQSIGIFFDPQGASCSATIPSGGTGTMFIMSVLGGGVAGGTTGAEFRVDGFPSAWFANIVPSPASNLQIGSPLSGVGCNIAFPMCQTGSVVLLYTVSFFASTQVVNQYVRCLARNPPLNPSFPCPLMTRCGFPFDIVCGTGGEGILNPTGSGCTVAAEPATWSRVKRLYGTPR